MGDVDDGAILHVAAGADPDTATPGWFGFMMLLGLSIAVYVLFRSMRKQLARVDVPHKADLEDASVDDAPKDDDRPA